MGVDDEVIFLEIRECFVLSFEIEYVFVEDWVFVDFVFYDNVYGFFCLVFDFVGVEGVSRFVNKVVKGDDVFILVLSEEFR